MMCVQSNRCMMRVSALQRGEYGEVCVIASTLCGYDLMKCDLFVLIWARVLRGFLLWCL